MSFNSGRRYADAQGRRWERGRPALVEGGTPSFPGVFHASKPDLRPYAHAIRGLGKAHKAASFQRRALGVDFLGGQSP